jgi:hypothetical protein
MNAKDLYLNFGFRPSKHAYPGAAGLLFFAVALAPQWHLYYRFLSNSTARALAFQAGMFTSCYYPLSHQSSPLSLSSPCRSTHNRSETCLTLQTDKHAASLGHSSELSSVLAKISVLTRKPDSTTEIEQDQEQELEYVDDRLYALLYHTRPGQVNSQRLAWLEEERVKEDTKEGCIRLPLDNEKL